LARDPGFQGTCRTDPAHALDELFRGRADISELGKGFEMTRLGGDEHMRQLEEAGYGSDQAPGPRELHVLNPVRSAGCTTVGEQQVTPSGAAA